MAVFVFRFERLESFYSTDSTASKIASYLLVSGQELTFIVVYHELRPGRICMHVGVKIWLFFDPIRGLGRGPR